MNLKLYRTTLLALVCAFASTLLFAAESANTNTTTTPTTGGSCVSYQRTYANGSTASCSFTPGPGQLCPLGLPFAQWRCSDGRWIRSQ